MKSIRNASVLLIASLAAIVPLCDRQAEKPQAPVERKDQIVVNGKYFGAWYSHYSIAAMRSGASVLTSPGRPIPSLVAKDGFLLRRMDTGSELEMDLGYWGGPYIFPNVSLQENGNALVVNYRLPSSGRQLEVLRLRHLGTDRVCLVDCIICDVQTGSGAEHAECAYVYFRLEPDPLPGNWEYVAKLGIPPYDLAE